VTALPAAILVGCNAKNALKSLSVRSGTTTVLFVRNEEMYALADAPVVYNNENKDLQTKGFPI
jgi:hypothetical protein